MTEAASSSIDEARAAEQTTFTQPPARAARLRPQIEEVWFAALAAMLAALPRLLTAPPGTTPDDVGILGSFVAALIGPLLVAWVPLHFVYRRVSDPVPAPSGLRLVGPGRRPRPPMVAAFGFCTLVVSWAVEPTAVAAGVGAVTGYAAWTVRPWFRARRVEREHGVELLLEAGVKKPWRPVRTVYARATD